MFADSGTARANSTTSALDSVHASTTKVIVSHFRKLLKNPAHNIAASGELATAMRMHFDALEASGVNAAITKGIRSSTETSVLTKAHLTKQYGVLESLGVSLPDHAKEYVTAQLLNLSAQVAPMVTTSMSKYSILKWQRTVHGSLLKARRATSGRVRTASAFEHSHLHPNLMQAVFSPDPPRHFNRVAFDDSLADESDEWNDGGWMDSDDSEDEIYLGGGHGGGGGDDYSEAFYAWADGGFTTPSGATVQYCTAFWALVALGGGSFAAALAYLDSAGAGVSLVVGSVALDPAALVLLVGILAALAAYLAVVC